ncbi:MAG: Ni/Fe hydrogenase subunit alpha [Promethearchaeota archaeon]
MSIKKIEPVTRIESHGQLTLEFDDNGTPLKAFFSTPALRGFEAFLRGAPIERVSWFASRICGVCPIPHAVNATQTLEKALGVTIPKTAGILREMLVLAQIIDSHALSFAFLSMPDLVPKENMHSIRDVQQHFPELVEKGIRLRAIGRMMSNALGGRNVHPVNVRIGGMNVNPLLDSDINFPALIKEALGIAQAFLEHCKEWFSLKSDLITSLGTVKTNYMSLSNEGAVSFLEGQIKIISPDGDDLAVFDPDDYLAYLSETTKSHSYMKLPYLKAQGIDNGIFRVNCLARANVNEKYTTPIANRELQHLRSTWGQPLESSLLSHWARLIEVIYACERFEELLSNPSSKGQELAVSAEITDGEAVGCLEAPRGTLFHHYTIKDGHISKANFIVATQNNGLAVNKALSETVKLDTTNNVNEKEIVHHCEMLIRAYDPCISCSTHVLRVKNKR